MMLFDSVRSKWYAHVPQTIRFLVVGGINSIVGLSLIWFDMVVLGLEPVPANALAYAVMLPVSLWGFARGVFRYSGGLRRAMVLFVAVFSSATLCNLFAVAALVRYSEIDPMYAQVFGMTVYVCVYYPLNRMMFAYLKRAQHAQT